MKNLEDLNSNPYQAYRYLLVQNIIGSFEKSHFQEARKDLQRCFSIDSQQNKLEMSIIHNLCLLVVHYKKGEIKKLFGCLDEIVGKVGNMECDLEKLFKIINQEEHLRNLLKRFILKEVITKKISIISGIGMEDFIASRDWLTDRHNFILLVNSILAMLLLQKNPTISPIHKLLFTSWFDRLKELQSSCTCGMIYFIKI